MNTPLATARSIPQDCDAPEILIANPDIAARRWIESTVMTAGLYAITCESANDLLARLQYSHAMCAILDLTLPDASGLEVQATLADAGVSVLFLTQERCMPSCVRAIQAGAADFLVLPCDAANLLHSLRNALQTAKYTRAQREVLGELRTRAQTLTPREKEVFELVCSGMLNKQIADRLAITEFTVQVHRGRVMKKLRAKSVAQLVRMAAALDAFHPNHRYLLTEANDC
jgi:FixJ family two-component response regulator